MFANILPDVAGAVGPDGKLQIAVDPRLVTLFQRCFPKAEVGAYDDRTLIDKDGNKALRLVPFAVEGQRARLCGRRWASALQYYRNDRWPIFRTSLSWCRMPARVAEFREQLASLAGQEGRHLLALDDDGRQARPNISRAIDGWGRS